MAVGAGFAYVGVALGASGTAAYVVGVAVVAAVGAVVGGLISAVSGGDIGEGMLYGAVGAVAAVGVVGALGGFGSATYSTSGVGVTGEGVTGVSGGWATGATSAGAKGVTADTLGSLGVSTGSTSGGAGGSLISGGESLGTQLVVGGLKGGFDYVQASEAADEAADEAEKNRAAAVVKQDKDLANRLAIARAAKGPEFFLNEKTALRQTETDQRIKEYDAKVATDVGTRGEQVSQLGEGVLQLKGATRSQSTSGSDLGDVERTV